MVVAGADPETVRRRDLTRKNVMKLSEPGAAAVLARHSQQHERDRLSRINQMYLMRFDGKKWVVFGDLQAE